MQTSIRFLSADETASMLAKDEDGFFGAMTAPDLAARSASSVEEYKARCVAVAREIPAASRRLLEFAVKHANTFFSTHALGPLAYLRDANCQPWVFASTEGTVYECGLPHTRSTVIFIGSDMFDQEYVPFYELIVHERVHVLQRSNPDASLKSIEALGYSRAGLRRDHHLARSNPDLDEYAYTHPGLLGGKPVICCYASATPLHIMDTMDESLNGGAEHPNEAIAYSVARAARALLE